MRVKRKDFKGIFDNDWYYYCSKVIDGKSSETTYIESAVKRNYITDNTILKAVRDFCPLEFLDFYDNKYFRFLYSTFFLNIFYHSDSFTNDFCLLSIPQDIFSPEEANILTSVLRRSSSNFGLVIRRLDTYTLTSQWKKQYITDESYEFTQKEWKTFDSRFSSKNKTDFEQVRMIKNEIEDKIICLIRSQILTGKARFGSTNIGEKNYEISELIESLLSNFSASPKMYIFIAEIYYRYGLPQQSHKILHSALELSEIDTNNKSKIKNLLQLIKSKKAKDKFLTIEEFTGHYLEDFTNTYVTDNISER